MAHRLLVLAAMSLSATLAAGSALAGPNVKRAASPATLANTAHAGLDVAGFVPGPVGVAADLVHAGIYAAQGNWGAAGLSAVAAVPVVGDAAKAGRLARSGARLEDRLALEHTAATQKFVDTRYKVPQPPAPPAPRVELPPYHYLPHAPAPKPPAYVVAHYRPARP